MAKPGQVCKISRRHEDGGTARKNASAGWGSRPSYRLALCPRRLEQRDEHGHDHGADEQSHQAEGFHAAEDAEQHREKRQARRIADDDRPHGMVGDEQHQGSPQRDAGRRCALAECVKPVNDNFGHACGDLLLKEVARRLQSCMRESDTASRLGGDEFVALLVDIEGRHGVMVAALKVLECLNAPYEIAGRTFDISASIGAALYPGHGTNSKSLMRSADLAMYAAKNAGRANVQFADAADARQH